MHHFIQLLQYSKQPHLRKERWGGSWGLYSLRGCSLWGHRSWCGSWALVDAGSGLLGLWHSPMFSAALLDKPVPGGCLLGQLLQEQSPARGLKRGQQSHSLLARLTGCVGVHGSGGGAAMVCWNAGEQELEEWRMASLWFMSLQITCVFASVRPRKCL